MKPTLALLPDFMCDEWIFMPLINRLSSMDAIFIGDLTGSGTIGGLASKVLARTPSQNLALIGLSFGGVVAMEMMRQAPDRIGHVILINVDHLSESAELRTTRRRQMSDVKAGKFYEVVTKELVPSYEFPTDDKDTAIADIVRDMAIDRGPDVFLSQSLALMTKRDYSETLEAWDKPIMIISGEKDASFAPHRRKTIASLMKSAQFHSIKGAGHFAPLEQPEQVNELIDEFLKI